MRLFISLFAILIFISACQSNKKSQAEVQSDINIVEVQEVLQAGTYTYLRVLEDGTEKWIAAPSIQAEIGKTYYFKNSMEMANFESKELDRTFETVYFVEKISNNPNFNVITKAGTLNDANLSQQATKPVIEKATVKIELVKGVITIAELYKNTKAFEGKTIKVKGKVTKFNPAIMNRNWIHLQDGTEYNGEFDLTLTTNAEVKVGDVITFEGKVSLDKDFGAGYMYKLIIEDAVIVK